MVVGVTNVGNHHTAANFTAPTGVYAMYVKTNNLEKSIGTINFSGLYVTSKYLDSGSYLLHFTYNKSANLTVTRWYYRSGWYSSVLEVSSGSSFQFDTFVCSTRTGEGGAYCAFDAKSQDNPTETAYFSASGTSPGSDSANAYNIPAVALELPTTLETDASSSGLVQTNLPAEVSDSKMVQSITLQYGTQKGIYANSQEMKSQDRFYASQIPNLKSRTYYYRLAITDPAGQITYTPEQTFQSGNKYLRFFNDFFGNAWSWVKGKFRK
ncbi:MAG: hypothetical protein US94_C0039G0007 [Berkelbacteria bacterium GW2011_GWB1_38_5]|nr:MAG: hypothetical protein US94_C0039G0007 [Berkelbacteria bacterium GW2011_GWB1_38_5]